MPQFKWWKINSKKYFKDGVKVSENFTYTSDTNTQLLTEGDLIRIVKKIND